jgi:hypothetical protein
MARLAITHLNFVRIVIIQTPIQMQLDPKLKQDIVTRANRLAGQIEGLGQMFKENRKVSEVISSL